MQYAALLASVGVWWLAVLYLYLSPNLPEADTLRNITLQTPMRVVSREEALIGQFGEQKENPSNLTKSHKALSTHSSPQKMTVFSAIPVSSR